VASTLAVFSRSGQKLGEFFPNERHADAVKGATDTRYSRLVRTGERSYVFYDSAAQRVRYFDLLVSPAGNLAVNETRSLPTDFDREKSFARFDADPMGVAFTSRVHYSNRAPSDSVLTMPLPQEP